MDDVDRSKEITRCGLSSCNADYLEVKARRSRFKGHGRIGEKRQDRVKDVPGLVT